MNSPLGNTLRRITLVVYRLFLHALFDYTDKVVVLNFVNWAGPDFGELNIFQFVGHMLETYYFFNLSPVEMYFIFAFNKYMYSYKRENTARTTLKIATNKIIRKKIIVICDTHHESIKLIRKIHFDYLIKLI